MVRLLSQLKGMHVNTHNLGVWYAHIPRHRIQRLLLYYFRWEVTTGVDILKMLHYQLAMPKQVCGTVSINNVANI